MSIDVKTQRIKTNCGIEAESFTYYDYDVNCPINIMFYDDGSGICIKDGDNEVIVSFEDIDKLSELIRYAQAKARYNRENN